MEILFVGAFLLLAVVVLGPRFVFTMMSLALFGLFVFLFYCWTQSS